MLVHVRGTKVLLLFCLVVEFVEAEDSFCRMAIRFYETVEQCTSVQFHSSIGYFYPDGKLRSVTEDTPLNSSIVYITKPGAPADVSKSFLFPGRYRAECRSDGQSIRFLESGCSEETDGNSCNSTNAEAYTLKTFTLFPIGGDWACPVVPTTDRFSIIIQGSCSDPGCRVDGVRNPLPTGAPTATPTKSPTGAPTETPAQSPISRERTLVSNLSLIFAQSLEIPAGDLIAFHDILETWFDAYYNVLPTKSSGISNLDSQITVTSQTVSPISNVVEYNHLLRYDATSTGSSMDVVGLILAPWKEDAYNRRLASELVLELPGSFARLGVRVPIPIAARVEEDIALDEQKGVNAMLALWALAAIPLVGIAYYFGRGKCSMSTSPATAASLGTREASLEHEEAQPPPRPAPDGSSAPNGTPIAQAQNYISTLPGYKDQIRSTADGNAPPLATAVPVDDSEPLE